MSSDWEGYGMSPSTPQQSVPGDEPTPRAEVHLPGIDPFGVEEDFSDPPVSHRSTGQQGNVYFYFGPSSVKISTETVPGQLSVTLIMVVTAALSLGALILLGWLLDFRVPVPVLIGLAVVASIPVIYLLYRISGAGGRGRKLRSRYEDRLGSQPNPDAVVRVSRPLWAVLPAVAAVLAAVIKIFASF